MSGFLPSYRKLWAYRDLTSGGPVERRVYLAKARLCAANIRYLEPCRPLGLSEKSARSREQIQRNRVIMFYAQGLHTVFCPRLVRAGRPSDGEGGWLEWLDGVNGHYEESPCFLSDKIC